MRPLLRLFNKYENHDVHDIVHVVLGKGGEVFVTVRPVEAWVRFAEVNGYDNVDDFYEATDYGDIMEWSENWHRGELNGNVLVSVPLEGYYRDGKDFL